MLDRFNSIWKNLFFDTIIGLLLIVLIYYNLYHHPIKTYQSNPIESIALLITPFGLYFLLVLHSLLLLVLTIKNCIEKKIIKMLVFLLILILLFSGLFFTIGLLFISTGIGL